MAAPPLLLVADDLSVIAAVKRVLAREGYECVLATNAADAVIAFGHSLPGLMLLQPSVESDRGGVLLEELQNHPDAKLLRVVLLGEAVPGFNWPVEPSPFDPEHLARTIDQNVRTSLQAGWSLLETAPPAGAPPVAPGPHEPEPWRATSPLDADPIGAADQEVPEPTAIALEPEPLTNPVSEALEEKLFGDLAADVEAGAMQSVESALSPPEDDELQRLEDDVRAEAQRRRQSREARAVEVKPSRPPPAEAEPAPGAYAGDEASFGDLGEAPADLPSRANEVLARAEQMVLETRAQGDAAHRADEADARRHQAEHEASTRRADHAQELVRTEREARHASEEQLLALQDELKRLNASLETDREALRAEVDAARAEVLELETKLEEVTTQVAAARKEAGKRQVVESKLDAAERTAAHEKVRREALEAEVAAQAARLSELELIAGSAVEESTKAKDLEAELAARTAELAVQADALHRAREDADAALALASEVELERQHLEETRSHLQLAEQHLAEARASRDIAQDEMLRLEGERDGLLGQQAELHSSLQHAQADMTSATGLLEDTAKERDQLRARVAALEPSQPLAERLGTELDAERHQRETAEAQLVDATAARDDARAEVETLRARLAQAEAGRVEGTNQLEARLLEVTSAHEASRTEATKLEAQVLAATAAHEASRTEVTKLEASLLESMAAHEASLSEATTLQSQLLEAAAAHEASRTEATTLQSQLLEAAAAHEASRTQTTKLEAQLLEAMAAQAASRTEATTLQAQRLEASAALEASRTEATTLGVQLIDLAAAHDAARAEGTRLAAQLADATAAHESARAEATKLEAQLTDLAAAHEATRVEAQRLEALLTDATATHEAARAEATQLESQLELERQRRATFEVELAETAATLESTRDQAQGLEATAQLAAQKVKQLEAREVMSLTIPGRNAMGIARHGAVDLEGLSRVVCQLVLGNAEVKLELGGQGGTRSLWFKRGQIIAAESTFDAEGLIGRARRDGLIDARQDGELRMLRGATAREQLEALKGRGFIRDIESVPLVQRYTEQVALDAFTEEQTQYRVVEEAPKPEVLLATVPRPTLPMLAESLRRAVTPDVMLERLGGGEAVPLATDSELDLRALGFSERERKMLTWVDGEATVEDLCLASGLKPDVAFRALLVAKLLGLIEVKPGTRKVAAPSGQLDLQRLEAKFDEVQDADYFTILGLSRAAGSEDVRRAFQRLSQEFDPLRFSGHPDPALQQRAQVVAKLLEEAARALEDDRRRVEYARHLLD